jgi:hypothetical protein
MSDSLTVTVIQCSGKGCNNTFTTSQTVSENFTYACRLHPKKKQKSIPTFQEFAHDKALDGKEKHADFSGQDTRKDKELLEGEPLNPKHKCAHGVYSPDGDTRYCSVCTPVTVTGQLLHMKKLRIDLGDSSKHKVGTFKNPEEQFDQTISLLAFYQQLKKKPLWLREVHFTTVDDLEGLINQINA